MKLITLHIDGRVDHVIDFDQSPRENDAPETFIIEKNNNQIKLFAFYVSTPDQALASASPYNDDIYDEKYDESQSAQNEEKGIVFQGDGGQQQIFLESANYEKENDKNVLFLKLSDTRTNQKPKIKYPLDCVFGDEKWQLIITDTNDDPQLMKVEVQLNWQGTELERSFLLCLAHNDDIRDVVLDFGSEATQMAIFKDVMTRNDICDVFSDMKELLMKPELPPQKEDSKKTESKTEAPKSKGAERYLQQENNSVELFRSIFYANKDAETGESPVPTISAEKKTPHIDSLYMLTTEVEAQNLLEDKYIQMPNMKLSGFGGVKEPRIGGQKLSEFNDMFFYRATIDRFLLCGLLSARTRCIRLYVLMPNIYDHFEVRKRLRWIRNDINEMICNHMQNKEKAEDDKGMTIAVEIAVISESDASFIGVLDILTSPELKEDETLQNGLYIIIDAGKGTTDFSIVKYDGRVVSKYRSGIIGAGNSVTYAHLFGLLHDFMATVYQKEYDHLDLRTFVCNKILKSNDLALQGKLMQAVDSYKIAVANDAMHVSDNDRYRSVDRSEMKLNNFLEDVSTKKVKDITIETVSLESFIDFVKAMVNVDKHTYVKLSEEGCRYINGMFHTIATDVCEKLKIVSAEEFHDIKGVMFAGRAFRDYRLREAIVKSLSETLHISLETMEYLNPHSAFNEKNICLYIRNRVLEGITNNRMLCEPFVRLKKEKHNQTTEKQTFDAKAGRWIRKLIPWGKRFNDYSIEETDSYERAISIADNGLVFGYNMTIKNPNKDLILIGGTYYKPQKAGQQKLFFAEDNIYLRNEEAHTVETITARQGGANMQTSPLAYPTLFPNISEYDLEKVYSGFQTAKGGKEDDGKTGPQNPEPSDRNPGGSEGDLAGLDQTAKIFDKK